MKEAACVGWHGEFLDLATERAREARLKFHECRDGAGAALLLMQCHTSALTYGVKARARAATSGMLIGTFAAAVGVSMGTIRYYERRGLLQTSVAERGRGRRYDASAMSRLTLVKAAQDLGFILTEIGALLRLNDGRHCDDARLLAESKLRTLRAKREALRRIDDALSQLIERCESTRDDELCPLIAALSA